MNAANRSLLLITVTGLVAVGGTAAAAHFRIPSAGTIAFVTVIMACVLLAMAQWWRTVDEAVREAHKSAWLWGGSLGLMPLIPLLIYLSNNQQLLEPLTARGPYPLVAFGVLAALTFEFAGYILAWAYWWLRRR